MKRTLFIAALLILVFVGLDISPASAEQFLVGGHPMDLYGYITQSAGFSLTGSHYDSPPGLQTALMNVFIEGDYKPCSDVMLYMSTMFSGDWAYDLLSGKSSWNSRLFDQSRGRMFIDDQYWQVLKSAWVNWSPGNWNIRLGKQIVVWGQTDGFRLMDQINPLDQRRGFQDVEFENTIIPVWLAKIEYYVPNTPNWISNVGLQFVWDPNITWIANQDILPGNNVGGIWAPNIVLAPGMLMGSANLDVSHPDDFDQSGDKFAARLQGIIDNTLITLNGFYGRNNDFLLRMIGQKAPTVASNGSLLLHPTLQGYYPFFKFVGGTLSRDFPSLKASCLGGVAPTLRIESLYAFGSSFVNNKTNQFEQHDEWRTALGVDWKVKINPLNPITYFFISGQLYYRRIMDYPRFADPALSEALLTPVEANNYMATLMINTSYFHNKLTPSFFWMRDITSDSDFFRFQLDYDYSNLWHYEAGVVAFFGGHQNAGFQVFQNKDQIYFKISYTWG